MNYRDPELPPHPVDGEINNLTLVGLDDESAEFGNDSPGSLDGPTYKMTIDSWIAHGRPILIRVAVTTFKKE